ncbi:MAG: hypothetical protein MK085_05430, partial [Phycisphaerales bacterium]|nr:hypothetical protein [Phycisphaerales bacterium]
ARSAWSGAAEDITPLTTAGLDAATILFADFSINKEKRPFIDRPYIGHLRAISRVLLANAMVRLVEWTDAEGEETTAEHRELADINVLLGAEELAAVIALIGHLHEDPILAHAMLATAIFREASIVTTAYVQEIARRDRNEKAVPAIDRAVLSRLRTAIDQVPRLDPFGGDASMASDVEHLSSSRWAWDVRNAGGDIGDVRDRIAELSIDELAAMLAYLDARGPIDRVDAEAIDSGDPYSETMRRSQTAHLPNSPPIGALARCDDYLPLGPSWTGDGPNRLAMTRAIVKAVKDDPTQFGKAFQRLNLEPIVPTRQMILNAYGQIGDTDQVLRMRPTGEPLTP